MTKKYYKVFWEGGNIEYMSGYSFLNAFIMAGMTKYSYACVKQHKEITKEEFNDS